MVKKDSQLNKYKYSIIAVGGSILIAIILIAVVGRPLWTDMQKVSKEAKGKRDELTRLEERLTNLKKLKEKEAQLKEQNTKLLAALPESKDVSRLFLQIEGVATSSGLATEKAGEKTLTEAENTAAKTSQPSNSAISAVTYEVKAKATDYSSFRTALSKFEQALRLVSIDKAEVNLKEEGDTTSIEVLFDASTYVRNNK